MKRLDFALMLEVMVFIALLLVDMSPGIVRLIPEVHRNFGRSLKPFHTGRRSHPSASATMRSNSFGHTNVSNTSGRVPPESFA
jgi:hypothetical protein